MSRIEHLAEGVTLYLGDCREVLPMLSGIDCVVTSPPYNQNIDQFKPSGMHKESRWVSKISSGYFDSLEERDYQEWQIELLAMMFAATSPTASVFYNHKMRWRDGIIINPLSWIGATQWRLRQELIWARNGSTTMNARMFAPNDERIYWLAKDEHKWNQDCVRFMSVWQIASVADAEHPCSFPATIPQRCIMATTDAGDLVFDPFLGSGTTGIAAVRYGRRFVGVEMSTTYFDVACRRVSAALAAPSMFHEEPRQITAAL